MTTPKRAYVKKLGGNPEKKKAQKPDGIRFTEEQKQALQELQERLSTSQANLVRWAVDGLIDKWRRDGRIVLPFRFDDEDLGNANGNGNGMIPDGAAAERITASQ